MLELSQALTARVGGPARDVREPLSVRCFAEEIDRLRQNGRRYRVLGGGSNVLASQAALKEPVVRTAGIRRIEQRSATRFRVEAGANLTGLAHRSARRGLGGLECCTGIPGTVGAAIHINAGGKFGTVASVVKEVTLLETDGSLVRREVEEADFGYRSSRFAGALVLEAELEFHRTDPDRSRSLVKDVLRHKRTTQPLRVPSAGCIFRNPPGDSAGRLIDAAGLKGTRFGGAMVSEVHANYIVNVDNATGDDFLGLVRGVRRRVADQFCVELQLEVEIWD